MSVLFALYGSEDVLQKGKPPREEDCVDTGTYRETLRGIADRVGNPAMANAFPEGYELLRRQHLNAWLQDHRSDFSRGKALKVRIPGGTVYAHFGGWKIIPTD